MNYYLKVIKNYAKFDGRARRKEYWIFALFNIIIACVLGAIEGAYGNYSDGDSGAFFSLFQLFIFIPSLAVGVRRMHDANKSGWCLLIPLYNLILTFTPGTKGENKYGPDPKTENQNTEPSVDQANDQNSLFCYKCGKSLDLDSKFCTKCGVKVVSPPME